MVCLLSTDPMVAPHYTQRLSRATCLRDFVHSLIWCQKPFVLSTHLLLSSVLHDAIIVCTRHHSHPGTIVQDADWLHSRAAHRGLAVEHYSRAATLQTGSVITPRCGREIDKPLKESPGWSHSNPRGSYSRHQHEKEGD